MIWAHQLAVVAPSPWCPACHCWSRQICDPCLAGKHRYTSFPEQAHRCASGILNLVHGDLCDPISPTTSSGNKYFLLLIDDLNRFMWLVLLPCKDHAEFSIKNFQVGIEVDTGHKLKILHTDRAGGVASVRFGRYCAERGVHQQLTAP
jgi:hypothetical protein